MTTITANTPAVKFQGWTFNSIALQYRDGCFYRQGSTAAITKLKSVERRKEIRAVIENSPFTKGKPQLQRCLAALEALPIAPATVVVAPVAEAAPVVAPRKVYITAGGKVNTQAPWAKALGKLEIDGVITMLPISIGKASVVRAEATAIASALSQCKKGDDITIYASNSLRSSLRATKTTVSEILDIKNEIMVLDADVITDDAATSRIAMHISKD